MSKFNLDGINGERFWCRQFADVIQRRIFLVEGVDLRSGIEVLVEDGEWKFRGVDADMAETVEDAGATAVLSIGDGFEVLIPVVGRDAVLVVDTRLVDGSYPGEIHGVGNEDGFRGIPRAFKLQIPLFTLGVGRVFAVLAGSWSSIYNCFDTIRRYTQADGTVMRDIELIPVVGFVWDEVQDFALVDEN